MIVWRSIGARLTAWYTLVLAAILALTAVGVWFGLRHSVSTTVDRELRVRLATVEAYRARADAGGLSSATEKWTHELGEDSMVARGNGAVRILDAQGRWLFRSADAEAWPDLPIPTHDLPPGGVTTTATINRRRLRILTAPVAGATVQVGLPLHAYDELTEDFFTTAAVASPLLLALAAVAGYAISRRALRPVDAINATARRISGRTLTSRLPVPASNDELRRLSLTLNEMLDRLDAENKRTRQFTADASHELRTPVAVIRATAEVTASKPRTPEEHSQAWLVVQEQARRIAKMIDDLLHLARADAQVDRATDEATDLAEEVRDACTEMKVVAAHAGLALSVTAPATLPFRGEPGAIHRLVAALLDNAVKYTPRGGAIQVTLAGAAGADGVTIEVVDTGVGLPADQAEHVFDRFYRVSKDRSRHSGGAGLGLAIVRSIARQHGGDVSIHSTPGAGCLVRVTLPA